MIQAQGNYIGSNNAVSPARPPDAPRLSVLTSSVEYNLNSAASVLARLTTLADRLGGPTPAEVAGKSDANSSSPLPTVVVLERGMEALNQRFDLIFRQIERLEQF